MPSGSQLSVSILTDGYYLIDEYTDAFENHYQSYIGFYSAEDASASLTITGATGTVSESNVNLAYSSSSLNTFSFTVNADVKITALSLIYGKLA